MYVCVFGQLVGLLPCCFCFVVGHLAVTLGLGCTSRPLTSDFEVNWCAIVGYSVVVSDSAAVKLLILVLAMTVVVLVRVSGVDLVTDPGAGPDGGSAGIGWGC